MLRSDKFRHGCRFELDNRNAATVVVSAGVALRLPLQLFLVVVVMVTAPHQSHALDLSQCRTALGMQSGEIPDTAITASSSFDPLSVGPASARIRTELHGGAWCPKEQVSKDTHEYLQIEFNHLTVITLVETQGRFGNGQGQEYMEQYKLEYQREDNGRWFKFRNRRQQEILQGNINTYIPELRDVEPPIIGRRIRFVPYSAHPRPVCVRVELYGCQWTDGVVSYSMPQGDRRKDIDLFDMTYDGDVIQPTPFSPSAPGSASAESVGNVESGEVGTFVTRVRLSGGLGQLTDGDEGQSNFRLDPRVTGLKGFEWVGWRNDSFAVDSPGVAPIEIVWKFDATRNFSSVRIHCNNMFTKDVRVFRAVRVWFSIGGSVFSSPPVYYRHIRDSITEFGRSVIIQLNHGIGRYVKIQLEFDSRWMLVSEFQFQSVYVTEDIPVEVDPSVLVSTTPVPIGLVKDHDDVTGNSIEPSIVNNAVVDGRQIPKVSTVAPPRDGDPNRPEVVPPVTPNTPRFTDEYIGIIVGVLISAFLFVVVIIIILVIRRRRRTCRRKYDSGSSYTGRGTYGNGAVKCSADLPQRRLPSIDHQPWNSGKLAIVNGGSCETDGLSGPYGDGLIAGAANEAGVSSDIDSDTTGTSTCCGLGVAGTCRSPGDENGCGRRGPVHVEFYRVPTEKDRERRYSDKLPKLPQTPDSSETYTSSRDYAMPSFNVSQPQFIAGLVPSETPVNHHNSTSLSTTATVIPLPLVVGPGANGSSIGGASTLQRRPCPPPPPPSYASAASSTNTGYYPQHLKTAPRRHHQGHQDSPYGFVGGLTTGGPRAGAALTLGGATVTGNGQSQAPASSAFQTASTIGRPSVETTVNVVEFPRENLRFVEKIGDGMYGEIHLCEAFHLIDYVPHIIGVSSRSVVVLVKTLRRNASELTRTDFERDLRVTSRTNDVNVVRLLGACLQGANETRCLILEFPRHGDLAQFLRHHSSPDDVMSATNSRCQQQRPKTGPILEYGTLVYMASQIASGMKHLESLHVVHRDIAARNCLVGDLYQVKVSDLGPGRDLYADDYSQDAKGSPLPVRWMSWEAALLGQLSTKSDVWSFGITLWEVLTYARARPLAALNNRQVFDNLERIRNSSSSSSEETISPSALPVPSATAADCIDDDDSDDDDRDVIGSSSGGPILLPGRPAGCPRETYDLMRECWRRDPDRRPTFRETHMFLQRLNVGYSPASPPPTVNNSAGTINETIGSVNNRQVPNRGSVGTMGYQWTGSRTALA